MQSPTYLLSLALLAAPALAQGQVLVVDDTPGPGVDHDQIHAAIAAASDGDTLLVKGGTYASFILHNRALKIVAELGASVKVTGGFSVRGLSADQAVMIRGLEVIDPVEAGLELKNNLGPVWIESCVLRGGYGDNTYAAGTFQADSHPGAVVAGSGAVVFARCDLLGGDGLHLWDEDYEFAPGSGGDGLRIDGGAVSVFEGDLVGGHGGSVLDTTADTGGWGGNGVRVEAGSVLVSGSSLRGGSGGFADSDLFFCGDGGDGGDGIHLSHTPGSAARSQDCSFAPGSAGGPGGPGCSSGAPGEAVDVNAGDALALAGSAHTLSISSPVREGGIANLRFGGEPGELVLAVVGAGQTHLPLDPFAGSLVVGAPQLLISMGVVPPSGSLVVPVSIGAAANPAVLARHLFVQGVYIDAAPAVWLGHASTLSVLDASL